MLTKIKRQDCLDKYTSFPLRSYNYQNDEELYSFPKVFKSYILTLPSKSFKGHVKSLGVELVELTKVLKTDTLIFLGDAEIPWLYQQNDFNPVREAQLYLVHKKISKTFKGGIWVDITELLQFTKHLSWLTRCNPSLPYFYFIDEAENVLGNICQYGNLHLSTLTKQSDKLLNQFLITSKFQIGNNNSCYNWFSKSGFLRGRKISTDANT